MSFYHPKDDNYEPEDRFEHTVKTYIPKWERLEERHPDKRMSDSEIYTNKNPPMIVLEVLRCGAFVIRECGISIFSTEEIEFDYDGMLVEKVPA